MEDYKIEKILDRIGISPTLLGYKYLVYAVKVRYKDVVSFEKLYEIVAEHFKVSKCSVERAMRYSYSMDTREIKNFFGTYCPINNHRLIMLIIRKLKEDTNE